MADEKLLTLYLPTMRWGNFDTLKESLIRQTIWKRLLDERSVELLMIDEHALVPERIAAFNRLIDEIGLDPADAHLIYPTDYDDARYGMKQNRVHNVMFTLAKGTYTLEIDDYNVLNDDVVERLLEIAQDYHDRPCLISGVMHTTAVPPITALKPEGEDRAYSVFKRDFRREDWGWPDPMLSWQDSRGGGVWLELNAKGYGRRHFTCNYHAWENNVSIAQTSLLREIGVDEEMDAGAGPYNQWAALRMFELYPQSFIIIDPTIVTFGLPHRQYAHDTPFRDDFSNIDNRALTPFLERRKQTHPIPGFLDQVARADKYAVIDTPPATNGHTAGVGAPMLTTGTQAHVTYLKGLYEPTKRSIAFYLPSTGGWGNFDPAMPFAKPLGGRETATVRLAQELAKQGWNVGLFCPVPFVFQDGNLVWQPTLAFTANLKTIGQHYDVIVSVEDAQVFRRVRAKLNILHEQCCHLAVNGADKYIDHYFLLSKYQQWSLRSFDMTIDADKCVIFGNGIDLARYDFTDVQTVPGRLVYSSSPDRGLHHLLEWWPTLKERHPDLSLKVFYNPTAIDEHRWMHDVKALWALTVKEGATLPGVEYVGGVDQMTLAREQKQAQMWVYPCDPASPTESYCSSVLEFAAAGVPMLMSDADCLGELFHNIAWQIPMTPVGINDDQWIKAISYWLKPENQAEFHQSVPLAREFAERRTWSRLATRWSDFLIKRLEIKERHDVPPDEAQEQILQLAENATFAPV